MTPIIKSGNPPRDLYGHLECLRRVVASTSSTSTEKGGKDRKEDWKNSGREKEKEKDREEREREEMEGVQSALRQLDVVRYALSNNLGRCFMHQM